MTRDSLGVFTLMFLLPGALLAAFLYVAFTRGTSRWSAFEQALVQQYGRRKGTLVALLCFLLFLAGVWGFWYLRRGMAVDVVRSLQ